MKHTLKALLAAAALLFIPKMALAQSCPAPTFTYGWVPTAAQWNQEFACKQAVLGYTPVNRAGDTMSGKLTTAISSGLAAGLNLPPGTVGPTLPVNGDVWTTAAGFFVQVNGTTYSLGSSSGVSSIAGTANQITASSGVGAVTLSLPSALIAPGTFRATGATTLSAALTYGGVTLSNSVTGTGSMVLSNSPTLVTPALGTPSAVNLANATNLPISSIASLGTGVGTWLATPSSANLAAAVTDETGSGALVFATNPVFTTPNLGTPSALVLTNATGTPSAIGLANGTGLPISTGVSGLGTGIATFLATPSSANLLTAMTTKTGTGNLVFGTSPTLASPAFSGTVTGAGTIPLSILATQAADTAVVNASGSTASPTAVSIGSCSGGTNALTYNTTTHAFGCNSISASGTVNSGTLRQLAYYAAAGTAVSSTPAFSVDASNNPVITGPSTTGLLVTNPVSGQGFNVAQFHGNTAGISIQIAAVNTSGYNSANSALWVGTDSGTLRSISAGGTVNVGGADYAEYESIAGNMLQSSDFTAGSVIGFDVNGEVTNDCSASISFGVISTKPGYIGGDAWGVGLSKTAVVAAQKTVVVVAYTGKVPVNFTGGTPGQYLSAVCSGTTITVQSGTTRGDNTVGRIRSILGDGRAQINVLQ